MPPDVTTDEPVVPALVSTGSLPDSATVRDVAFAAHRRYAKRDDGEIASYIPVLAAASLHDFEALKRAIDGDVRAAICSRCWSGRTAPLYGYEGGGASLRDAILSPTLGGAKTRVALGYLLADGRSHGEIASFFETGSAT